MTVALSFILTASDAPIPDLRSTSLWIEESDSGNVLLLWRVREPDEIVGYAIQTGGLPEQFRTVRYLKASPGILF